MQFAKQRIEAISIVTVADRRRTLASNSLERQYLPGAAGEAFVTKAALALRRGRPVCP